MRKIIIKEPMWKNRSVGISEDKITDDLIIVISYQVKSGSRLYPTPFTITREKALSYPSTRYSKLPGKFKEIPIQDLDIYGATRAKVYSGGGGI